ncbi:MAG: Hsp70 family protein [Cyanobacteriota bacterium]|nr:Hsp70 family protein [Cyanobacteriota bacterium]
MAGTLAIDLGSTTTVVAYQAPGEPPRLLPLPPYSLDDPVVVPSLLWLASADAAKALLGRQVLDAGLAHGDSPQLQRDFKRLIGHPTNQGEAAAAAGARLLRQVWDALPADLAPGRLVMTAPIESYGGYRQWLQSLAESLGIDEVALVDEPTAAAIGCGLPAGSTVLVVDLGGGTSDLALVQVPGGEGRAAPLAQLLRLRGQSLTTSRQQLRCAKVLGKAGLAIGGRDIDRWIAHHLCPDAPLEGSLLERAEWLKCQLSQETTARTLWSPAGQRSRELQLEAAELDALLQRHGLIEQLDRLLDAVVVQGRNAGIEPDQINAVLPVGGSSRLRAVQAWLQQRLGSRAIRNTRPVEAVALGALALTPGVRVRDVLSQGVSLRCWDRRSGCHRWHPLYVPGQQWPTEQPLELVLACSRDGQQAIELVLGETLDQHRSEVVFEQGLPRLRQRFGGSDEAIPWPQQPPPLPLQPPGEAGQDRLRLQFSIDAEGQLLLQVQDQLHGATPQHQLALGTLR